MICSICGEEIKQTDGEALHFEVFSIKGDNCNNGDVCGDCVLSEGLFKLWRSKNSRKTGIKNI